jgi:NitT/TauT family transport system substrate-binding protein
MGVSTAIGNRQQSISSTIREDHQMRKLSKKLSAATLGIALVAAACGSDDKETATTSAPAGGSTAPAADCATPKPVKLQLQWVTQAQFAGYFAAVDQGFYKEMCLDVQILEGAVDIVPQTVLASGAADFAIAWVPKALQSREQGAGITNISQVFQRSGTLQVSWKDSGIGSAADLNGKKVGNWGFGNEFELFAGMSKAGIDPSKDITLVQQQFDMQALLNREIDAAQAMIYNEYAQVLEAVDPATGELYTADQFNVIDWNADGSAMLQDAIWANTAKLAEADYKATAEQFVAASLKGWAFCRDNVDKCVDIVLSKGSKLGKSHQTWQMNEINKLVWPAPNGVGTMDIAQWDQTIKLSKETKNAEGSTVLTKDPDAAAYNGEINAAALKMLDGMGIDTKGAGYKPITVTLNEGGA